jgi:CubicO group peptidase (beta-lactamase class C family)
MRPWTKIRHTIALASLLATFSAATAVARRLDDAALVRLGRVVPAALREAGVPGAAVAVVRDGEIVFAHGFGVRRSGESGAVSPDTVFEAASLAKTVFSRLVLDLADAGGIDLDRPLVELAKAPFTPWVKGLMASEVVDDPRLARITPRHVLSHRSGFPNWARGRPLELLARPGERFGYSGEGFSYLQRVVEERTGRRLAAWAEEKLLRPLGMTRTSYVWQERFRDDAAWGHDATGQATVFARFKSALAAGSLYTTAHDFARFLIAALADPRIRTPQTRVEERIAWGLGWGLEMSASGRAIWHWGDNGEYKALVFAYPADRSGVVVLTHGTRGLRVGRDVVKALYGPHHPALDFKMLDYGE